MNAFVYLPLETYRGVVWTAAVHALLADGWLPDDERAVRLATNAWQQTDRFRTFLHETGHTTLSRAMGGRRSNRATERMTDAFERACRQTYVAAGAQLGLQAWWDGAASAYTMTRVLSCADAKGAERVRAALLERARSTVAASGDKWIARVLRDAWQMSVTVCVINLGNSIAPDGNIWSRDAFVAQTIREATPCPTLAQMFEGDDQKGSDDVTKADARAARLRLAARRDLERLL